MPNDNLTPEEIQRFEQKIPLCAAAVFLLLALSFLSPGFLCAGIVNGTGFVTEIHIDHNADDDSGDGSEGDPLQNAPYMHNFGGAYAHAAGDRFIFEGNVTWPNECFPIIPLLGGTGGAGNVQDYYGVDHAWYSGGSWGRPIFDAGAAVISGGFNSFMSPLSNTIVDSIEMKGFHWDAAHQTFGTGYIGIFAQTNVWLLNLYLHDWSHDTADNGCLDVMGVVVGSTSLYNPGCMASNCVITGYPNGVDSGGEGAFYCFPNVIGCTISNMSCGIIHNGESHISNNIITDIGAHGSFSGTHGAAIENAGNNLATHISGNLLLRCAEENIFERPQPGAAGAIYIWNNITAETGTGSLLLSAQHTSVPVFVWGNVFENDALQFGILNEDGPWTNANFQDNLCVGGGIGLDGVSSYVGGTRDHNVTFDHVAAATADGYTLANRYRPVSAFLPTIGTGVDLSTTFSGLGLAYVDFGGVPRTNDIGAWQYLGNPTAPSPFQGVTIISRAGAPVTIRSRAGAPVTITGH